MVRNTDFNPSVRLPPGLDIAAIRRAIDDIGTDTLGANRQRLHETTLARLLDSANPTVTAAGARHGSVDLEAPGQS